jgi:hypothetical protein
MPESSTVDRPVEIATGRCRVPRSRAVVSDLLHFHQRIPTCAHDRVMNLASLAAARDTLSERVSLPVLFTKAFAAVAGRHPEFQQTWRQWPVEHLYQHAEPVALLTVARRFQNADWLFWGRLTAPQRQPLLTLQQQLDRYATEPVQDVFRQQWQLSGLPRWIRRGLLWWSLNLTGAKRTKRTGTFTVTSISGVGAEIQHPPTIATSTLTYGPIDSNGQCRVTVVYDHRLMDGLLVARVLKELELELTGTVVRELKELMNCESLSARAA